MGASIEGAVCCPAASSLASKIPDVFQHCSGIIVKSNGCHMPNAAEPGADAAGTSNPQARRLDEAERDGGE